MSAQDYSDQLSLLKSFKLAVWGDKSIFKKEFTHGSCTIEYLDFAEHHEAVQSFCPTVFSDKLVVFEEYRVAVFRLKEKDAFYRTGACIIGQPGIGEMRRI